MRQAELPENRESGVGKRREAVDGRKPSALRGVVVLCREVKTRSRSFFEMLDRSYSSRRACAPLLKGGPMR